MKYLFATLLFIKTLQLFGQTPLAGIINRYAAVLDIDFCNGKITVQDTTGFRVGDHLLLIQMQGAQIVETNNAQFGDLADLRNCGRHEICLIDSVATDAIFAKHVLVNRYDMDGSVQVVSFPKFQNAVVTDTLRAKNWDGTTGGVLALEVENTLQLNAPVLADGAGFRGGVSFVPTAENCNVALPQFFYFYNQNNWRSAAKGEGVAKILLGKEFGRGAQANGGGGGNDHNSGGGGGGNVVAGGRGGENDEPSTFGCPGRFPGVGGKKIVAANNRVFMGGGGGAGHANNFLTTSGAAGGGIIFLMAGEISGMQQIISANGLSAGAANNDGGGGAGAGGTIFCQIGQAAPQLSISVAGGRGGNVLGDGNRCQGPGGGGSGGLIFTNQMVQTFLNGGQPGILSNSTNPCNGTSLGATAGENGTVGPLPILLIGSENYILSPAIVQHPVTQVACVGNAVFVNCQAIGNQLQYQWQIFDGLTQNWTDVPASPPFFGSSSAQLEINPVSLDLDGKQLRCRIENACFSDTSQVAALQILAFPTAQFSASIGQNGWVSFQNLSQDFQQLIWDFGDGSTSSETSPQHQYQQNGNYTVTLQVSNACGASIFQQELMVIVVDAPEILTKHGWRIYPNPATDQIFIQKDDPNNSPNSLQILNAQGQVLLEKTNWDEKIEVVEVKWLPKGIYILKVVTQKGRVLHQLLIKS